MGHIEADGIEIHAHGLLALVGEKHFDGQYSGVIGIAFAEALLGACLITIGVGGDCEALVLVVRKSGGRGSGRELARRGGERGEGEKEGSKDESGKEVEPAEVFVFEMEHATIIRVLDVARAAPAAHSEMYLLYSLALGIGLVLLSPYFLFQGLRRGKYLRSLGGRLGSVPVEIVRSASRQVAGTEAIWVHAVSVGETMAAIPLIRGLRQRFPERAVYVSTTTETGQATARERLAEWAGGLFYFPLDLPWAVRRAFRGVKPGLVVILETEIWPNFLREAAGEGVPVAFANARISAGSLPKYERVNRFFGGFLQQALGDAALFLAQSQQDAERLLRLGAPAGKVAVVGNMKYDVPTPAGNPFSIWLREQSGKAGWGPLLVAGSVIAGEEAEVLEAFEEVRRSWPGAVLVLAPRKPERFEGAAEAMRAGGRRVVRRSGLRLDQQWPSATDVILLDTIGELPAVYGAADVVFVGGSFVAAGGHNVLEPAAFGKAPAFGPHMENFPEMARKFLELEGGAQVSGGKELGQFWNKLLADGPLRQRMGSAAAAILEENRGATVRTLEAIGKLMAQRAGPG